MVEVAGRADERTRRVTGAIARGGMAAFDEFYAEWFDFAYKTARRVTGRDEAMCLDIVQEAMLRVARTIRPMRTEDDVRRWLVRVVHTTALDELRRERRRRGRERARAIEGDAEMCDRRVEEEETIEWLRGELRRVGATDRALLRLRFAAGRSLEQAGRAVGMSGDAAHGRIRRAVARLRHRAEDAS